MSPTGRTDKSESEHITDLTKELEPCMRSRKSNFIYINFVTNTASTSMSPTGRTDKSESEHIAGSAKELEPRIRSCKSNFIYINFMSL